MPKMSSDAALESALAHKHLPILDGLRAIAIALVILFHFGVPGISGGLGVNVFFVISGFLITWLLLAEIKNSGRISFKAFYARRALRIFPAYYAFLIVFGLLSLMKGDIWPIGNIVAVLTYTMDWYVPFHPNSYVIHLWSLAVEEQFYLFWPLAASLLAVKGSKWLVGGSIATITAGVLWRSLAFLFLGLPGTYMYTAFDTRLDNLAIGCLLAVLLRTQFIGVKQSLRYVAWTPWAPFFTAALVGLQSQTGGRYRNTVGYTVEALLVALCILQLLVWSTNPLWRWLDHRSIKFIGRISYPLYLYNSLGDSIARRISPEGAVTVVVSIIVTFALASASYYIVEQPFLRLKRRVTSAPRAPLGAIPEGQQV